MPNSPAAGAVMMVRPANFGANPETADSNRFQTRAAASADLNRLALAEFDGVVEVLERRGVEVGVFEGNRDAALPDEVFANNWISTHPDGRIVLYPMLAHNRRLERRQDIVESLALRAGERFDRVVDLTALEHDGQFVEGTGSLVIDHVRAHAYACRSPRTTTGALESWATALSMTTLSFTAVDAAGMEIYHTNVMMALAPTLAVVCLAAVAIESERLALAASLETTGRELMPISLAQMSAFAANILALETPGGPLIALSGSAVAAFDARQRRRLESHAGLAVCDIPKIETYGGGSLRCMLTENWLAATPSR